MAGVSSWYRRLAAPKRGLEEGRSGRQDRQGLLWVPEEYRVRGRRGWLQAC